MRILVRHAMRNNALAQLLSPDQTESESVESRLGHDTKSN